MFYNRVNFSSVPILYRLVVLHFNNNTSLLLIRKSCYIYIKRYRPCWLLSITYKVVFSFSKKKYWKIVAMTYMSELNLFNSFKHNFLLRIAFSNFSCLNTYNNTTLLNRYRLYLTQYLYGYKFTLFIINFFFHLNKLFLYCFYRYKMLNYDF
jgi:hypothetical protein